MKIALISGGHEDEHEVSRASADNIRSKLKNIDVSNIVINKNLKQWHIGEQTVTASQGLHLLQKDVDVALLMLHGTYGEDGTIQGALESVGVAYTGSGVIPSAMAMDKFAANLITNAAGLDMPNTTAIHKRHDTSQLNLQFPVIVKPRHGGSTVGVTICQDANQLQAAVNNSDYAELIIQQLIVGREFTCGVVQTGTEKYELLPPSEVISDGLFDYNAKYSENSSAQEITPADVTDDLRQRIQSAALTAHQSLGCKGITRSDFILSRADNKLYYIETNTCPGMTKRSFIPAELQAAGLDMGQVMLDQCKLAIEASQ